MALVSNKEIEALEKRKQAFESFKNKAIDFEEGDYFHRNIPDSDHCKTFYKNRSFILFKIMKIEDVNTCYIYYMFGQDDEVDFKNCFYALINFCIGNDVKFIYYSEKEKINDFYRKFLKNFGFRNETRKKKDYKDKTFICKKCGKPGDKCTCNSVNIFV